MYAYKFHTYFYVYNYSNSIRKNYYVIILLRCRMIYLLSAKINQKIVSSGTSKHKAQALTHPTGTRSRGDVCKLSVLILLKWC